MKKLALLVHGIHAENTGKHTIRKLASHLINDGWEVEDFDYGWRASFQALFLCKKVARSLKRTILEKSYHGYDKLALIGHSHGSEIIAHASDLLSDNDFPENKPKLHAVLINPALDSKRQLSPVIDKVDIWYTPDDGAVLMAEFIPFIPWGKMGRTGFLYPGIKADLMCINLNGQIMSNYNIKELSRVDYVGHKGFFNAYILRKCIKTFLKSLNG